MKKKLSINYIQWKKWIDNKNLQTVIVLPFTLIGVCAILSMSVALYIRFINTAEEMNEQKNFQIVEQVNQSLNDHLKQMMKTSDTVYYQVLKQKDTTTDSIYPDLSLLYDANQSKLVSIALFDISGAVVEAVPISNTKKNVLPQKAGWYIDAAEKIDELHFSTPHVQNIFDTADASYSWVVSLSRYVEFNRNGSVEEGVLLVDMNFNGIEQVLKSTNLGKSSYLYLMGPDGEIIYHPRQQLLYAGLTEEDNKTMAGHEDGSYVTSFQGKERMITVKTVGYTGWKLVAVVPMEEVVSQYSDFQTYVFLFALCLLFILIQASSYVSKKITDPLYRLEDSVEKLESGDWDAEIAVSGSEEIRHLGLSIRSMVAQLRKLMADIVTEQELKRQSELEALQTQINPHFLYNTLDSIVWMIENEKYEGAVTMITSLAKIFRISISKGKSIIPVREELAHGEHYMAIQSIRYKNRFTYRIEAEEEVKDCATVKLILQPMIENAINHGIAYMDEEDGGQIIVRALRQGDELWMEVEDNGCGMTEEKVRSLRSGGGSKKGSGIGMNNVHERIQIHFGKQYGVNIYSEPDEGTLIRMVMPLQRKIEP